MHKAFPDKEIWFTECSGSHGPTDPPAQVFSDTLKWHARNLVLGVTRNWGQTVVNWNLALDPSGGPHNNGCDTCTGVVTVGPGQTVTRDAEYYTLGHLARFVRPGAVRIASTSFGTTGWNGQIMDVAFRNPDGSTVLVAHNENDNPAQLRRRRGQCVLRLHAARRRAGDVRLAAVARRSTTGNACCPPTGRPPRQATTAPTRPRPSTTTRAPDGPPAPRKQPGQTLQVDLGARTRARPLVLDTGPDVTDYPRGYAVSTSNDGTTWSAPVTGSGTGQLTRIALPADAFRYVRIVSTASAAQWWSVADLRIYR